ncbi:MAG: HAMP domain-containing sensor histidine kinase [Flavipsychrobacter sp.]
MQQYLNWKTYLTIIAVCIVGASLYYTNQLASKLAIEERKEVEKLVDGFITINKAAPEQDVTFVSKFISDNTTIPLIITDEEGNIIDFKNIDTARSNNGAKYLEDTYNDLKNLREPLVADLGFGLGRNYVYYGDSYLLTQLRYYPFIQLGIIILFLLVVVIALSTAHKSIQNQVWVGLSKETAHQLGTPLSSIEGWLELLKDDEKNHEAVNEMQKDLDRLKLVADRFGKVGSVPNMVEENLISRLESMVGYMQKRAPAKVDISLKSEEPEVLVNIYGPLWDWVIENLIRNALDAMEGKGSVVIEVNNTPQQVIVDVSDDGKGIPKHQAKKIFNPGFTTKKRGWGLGLSLSKRIIQDYHHGSIFVKESEVGVGTTFRIILRR